ncbi:hypothetical protein K457DRAFT_744907 [Linnemannia elongata AG-77]|uniref:Uncharacterized protein n=1 Tax=Linnemannia elongata AG-77 TaxID=1314771 RepID=A0A197JML1_9FUNG|nr:hypothetical protein K457DRAFT_744907 [Linnemannia elongata AG-77]
MSKRRTKTTQNAPVAIVCRYCDGKGVVQDYSKAMEWFVKGSVCIRKEIDALLDESRVYGDFCCRQFSSLPSRIALRCVFPNSPVTIQNCFQVVAFRSRHGV